MVAYRLPGPAAIDPVAPARDPGVRATPEEFGAGIGASAEHFGAAATEIGAQLYHKRQTAQDEVAASTYRINADPAYAQAVIDTKTKYPDGGDDYNKALPKALDDVHQTVTKQLVDNGIQFSENGQRAILKHSTELKSKYLVEGVVYANNEKVAALQTQLDKNTDVVKSRVLSGQMSIDDGLKAVDDQSKGGASLWSGSDLQKKKDGWREGVIDAAIESKTKAGDLTGAEALKKQYYGATPKYGQNIYSAIYAQESGSGRNTKTSVTGARGGMQIQPATFAQYAKPGENIDNEADNQAVGRRIIDDLSAKAGGDPARIAVGYFSGPGNIAPPGSPTPWKVDRADPTGKTVSSYVSDVMKRMGGEGGGDGATVPIGTTDASGDPSDGSVGDAAPIAPNAKKALYWDHQFKAALVDQHHAETQQKQAAKVASDARELEIFKDIHSDAPTITTRQILNDPVLTKEAAEKLVNHKVSYSPERADKTYGRGFYEMYQRVHAPEGDPRRITDPRELYSHVGPNGDLTVPGVDKLVAEIQGKRTPEGEAAAEMKKQLFATAKSQISGTDPLLHLKDPKGEELFLKWMAQFETDYAAKRKDNKTAAQLFNPDSPDYLGKTIGSFKRKPEQMFADMIADQPETPTVKPFDPASIKTLDEAQAAFRSGKMTAAQARALAVEKGWAKPRPTPASLPQVPRQ